VWDAFRKWHGYIRFDLTGLPQGKVVTATLRLMQVGKVEVLGGPCNVEVYRLKSIGDNVCEWQEETLNDTNFTTWSALPQNVSVSVEGLWVYDVTKAVADWLTGDTDKPDQPIAPNCGFHLYDPDFGKPDAPIQRWIDFSSKEGNVPPLLTVTIALDLDGDGYFGDTDCNEEDPAINPGAVEECDGVDQDCDGAADDEGCDGVDNDCDGQVDEGEDLCGDGQMCLFHKCMKTCYDECSGPYDLKCEKNGDGVWQKYGCKNADADPCLDWYVAETCDTLPFCEYGSCSFNCVDECDPEDIGKKTCVEGYVGDWYVADCADYDGDGCLDWGDFKPCGPSATCADGVCGIPCFDSCPKLGIIECLVDLIHVQACYDFNGDGCVEYDDIGMCDPVTQTCAGGECFTICEPECEIGTMKCASDGEGAQLLLCKANPQVSQCGQWVLKEPCPGGCNADETGCADGPVEVGQEVVDGLDVIEVVEVVEAVEAVETSDVGQPEPAPDVVTPPDGPADVPAEAVPDVPVQPDAAAADGPPDGTVPAGIEEGISEKDRGCQTGSGAGTGGMAMLVLLMVALLGAGRRTAGR
jgi:MYXO-CTERM domain-containing protein